MQSYKGGEMKWFYLNSRNSIPNRSPQLFSWLNVWEMYYIRYTYATFDYHHNCKRKLKRYSE